MKRIVLVLSLLLVIGNVAMAAEKPAIGYVDMRKVLLESKAGKKTKSAFEKLIKEKEAPLKKEEEKLKAMQEAMQKDALVMSDAQKIAKQREFQTKAEAYQKKVNEAKHELNKKDNEFTTKSMSEIRKIIADLAKEMNLSLVLEQSETGLLYADSSLNLTAKVIERYDAATK